MTRIVETGMIHGIAESAPNSGTQYETRQSAHSSACCCDLRPRRDEPLAVLLAEYLHDVTAGGWLDIRPQKEYECTHEGYGSHPILTRYSASRENQALDSLTAATSAGSATIPSRDRADYGRRPRRGTAGAREVDACRDSHQDARREPDVLRSESIESCIRGTQRACRENGRDCWFSAGSAPSSGRLH